MVCVGPLSHHANEFLVCSNSIRLFRAQTNTSINNDGTTVAGTNLSAAASNLTDPTNSTAVLLANIRQTSTTSPRLIPIQENNTTNSENWCVNIRRPALYDTDPTSFQPRTSFTLLDSITYPGQLFKCIGWSHVTTMPYLVAAGQISGKLVAMNFATPTSSTGSLTSHDSSSSAAASDTSSRIVKEFHPRYARACHVVCWNPIQTSQVAVGLDRVRNGCGTLIWDIEQKGTAAPSATSGSSTAASQPPVPIQNNSAFIGASNILNTNRSTVASPASVEIVTEPLGRVSNSEATLSLNWLPGDPYSLAVGTGFKWLRIYDIRGNSRPTSVVAHAKSVNGVSFDPFNPMRLSTFSEEGTIKIWDLRMITRKEIFSIPSIPVVSNSRTPKTLIEVSWCPTAPHRIATLHRDEDGFRLWDLSGSLPTITANMASMVGTSPIGGPGGNEDSSTNLAEVDLKTSPSAQEIINSSPSENATDSAPSRSIRIPCLTGPAPTNPPPTLSSLSWHPSQKQRVLAITSHGLVEDMALHDTIPIGWGSSGPAFAVNQQLFVGTARGGDGSTSAAANTSHLALLTTTSSSDPTAILTYDISTRMRVRSLLGYGLDVFANHNLGTQIISTLRTNPPQGDLETQLALESVRDEETLLRVWEWMIQSERLTSAMNAVGVKKSRFTGVLSLLLLDTKLSLVAAAVAASGKKVTVTTGPTPTPAPTTSASSSTTGMTLLSILKNQDSTPTHSVHASSFTTPSLELESSTSNGFLPAGFRVYLSHARTEALRLCDGWFDLFNDGGGGKLVGSPGSARRNNMIPPSSGGVSLSEAHQAYEHYLTEFEAQGRYEEAARVAVFHLDLERALQSLTLGAKKSQQQSSAGYANESNRDLGLVAMALSGYANFAAHSQQQQQASNDHSSLTAANQLWNQTWTSALGGSGQHLSSSLKAIFSFLSSFAPTHPTAAIYSSVLNSDGLLLKDKLGFVLRFLPDDELLIYLVQLTRELISRGDLDGLMLTGLNNYELITPQATPTAPTASNLSAPPTSPAGPTSVSYTMELLQSYLNRTSDIQSAAILGCFAGVSINFSQTPANSTTPISPSNLNTSLSDPNDPSTAISQWITLYRSLLNQWNLWSERAKFDVARALIEKTWLEEEAARVAALSTVQRGSNAPAAIRRPAHHTAVRQQISVRCNFCGQSLSLEAMSGGGSGGAGAGGAGGPGAGGGPPGAGGRTAMFRPRGRVGAARGVPDQNSVRIRGCPHCKKSLPRCSLCLVSFDVDTPHSGPTSGPVKQRKKNPLSESQEEDLPTGAMGGPILHVEDDTRFDSSTTNAFEKWFTWCQACRHGGHAEHMADWFGQHSECPVTDCHCRCMNLDLLPPKNSLDALKPIHQLPHPDDRASMLQANQQLAEQQMQFYHQLDQQSSEFQYQQTTALQQIHQQYPNGLPLDVLALAQAIQLMNLARGTAPGGMLPSYSSADSPALNPSASHASHLATATGGGSGNYPFPSPSSTSSSGHVHSAPNQQLHQSQSSPYLIESITGSTDSTTHSVTHPHGHAHSQSSVNLLGGARPSIGKPTTTPTAPPKGTFPLTRW